MANRYWVGGTASWDGTAGTKWALTSGGAGGQAVPTSADDVFFDANSGANTVTIATGNTGAKSITCTGFTGTLAGSAAITVAGNVTLVAGMTVTYTGTITISATSTITSAGKSLGGLTIDGVGITATLADNYSTTAGTCTLTNGTLDINNKALNAYAFNTDNSNTRTLAFGTGSITATVPGSNSINIATATSLTITGTPVFILTNATSSGATIGNAAAGYFTEANALPVSVGPSTGAAGFYFTNTGTLFLVGVFGSVNLTGLTGTSLGQPLTIYGDLTLGSGGTYTGAATTRFGATSGTKTVTTNGATIDCPINFNGAGGTWKLIDGLTQGSTRALTHTNGTIDLNGKTLTVGTQYVTAAGTKNLTFNGGTVVCPAATTTAWNNAAPTNFTTTAGTGTGKISMTAATAKTFVGGGSTYNCTLSNDGAGALTISGSNTFTTLANGVQPTTFTFTAGTTTTVTNWSINGTAGNLVTIGSATAASHTLFKASGIVSANYLSISRSTATGGGSWYAGVNSTNGGNNVGWIFAAPSTSNFFLFF